MPVLEHQAAFTTFLEQLKCTQERVLILDYDGTLAPFNVDRDSAFPYPEIPAFLNRITERGTRLVMVTGRPAREVVVLGGVHPHPEIWGSHGLERLTLDGSYSVLKLPDEDEANLLAAADAVRHEGFESNLEIKPGGVAVHWRGLSAVEIEDVRKKVLKSWRGLLSQHHLVLLEFDGGIEIKTAIANKGNAVERILSEASSHAVVAYLGDDLTDEDAFRALKGKGLTILVRPEPRPSEAEFWLKPPEELIEFLHQWLAACGGKA